MMRYLLAMLMLLLLPATALAGDQCMCPCPCPEQPRAYQSYEEDRPIHLPTRKVALQDNITSAVLTIGDPKRFLAPVSINGHDPEAILDPLHYEGYEVLDGAYLYPNKRFNVRTMFAPTTRVTITRAIRLLMPADKKFALPADETTPLSTTAPVPPGDAYLCYKAAALDVVSGYTQTEDQFRLSRYTVKSGTMFCNATAVDGHPRADNRWILCYGASAYPLYQPGSVFLTTAFGQHAAVVNSTRDLCVPATLVE